MALMGMRGLSVFISDIRNCQNKEQERLRVDKELGNIRTRFKNEKVSFLFLYFHWTLGSCLVDSSADNGIEWVSLLHDQRLYDLDMNSLIHFYSCPSSL